MNAKEGMRRLGLLLGVVGAVSGAFVSYIDLHDTISARSRYRVYDSLVKSDLVQQYRNNHFPRGSVPPGYNPEADTVDKNGIKTIHWKSETYDEKTKHLEIEFIEMADGTTVYPAALTPPGMWAYLRPALFPLLGFLIPFGAIRALTWVGLGFAQK